MGVVGPLASVVCLGLCLASSIYSLARVPPNLCRMTYMWPNYIPLRVPTRDWGAPAHFSLMLYREGGSFRAVKEPLRGHPVLYIPGNAGSGRQVRSIATQASKDWTQDRQAMQTETSNNPVELDLFAVDFDEDLTALSGPAFSQQVSFVNNCVNFIIAQYGRGAGEARPQSVILVGHSMGGLVARAVFLLPDYVKGTVETIVTISTPHAAMPAYADAHISSQLHKVNAFWREGLKMKVQGTAAERMSHVVLASIGGGRRDVLVPTELCDVGHFCTPARCLAVSSTAIDAAFLSVDHQAAVWCNQLVKRVVLGLRGVILAKRETPMNSVAPRREALHAAFMNGVHSLEAVSFMPSQIEDHDGALGPSKVPARAIPSTVRVVRARGPFLRESDVRRGDAIIWQVPALPSSDGVGSNVVLLTSLPSDTGWRLIVCSHAAESDISAEDRDILDACVSEGEGLLHTGARDVSHRVVSVEAQDCTAAKNADCIPRNQGHRTTRSLVSLSAHELGTGRFLVFLAPPQGSGVDKPQWVVAVPLTPSTGTERHQENRGAGGWYIPPRTLPGSIIPIPSVLRVEVRECGNDAEPLFLPSVLQAPAERWHSGFAEAFLDVEVAGNRDIPLWRHQWISPAQRRWVPAVAVIGDPLCTHDVRVDADFTSMIGHFVQAHAIRLFALSHATISFATAALSASQLAGKNVVQAIHGRFFFASFLVWVVVLVQPVVHCLFSAECSRCGSLWGCILGGAVVQEMHDEDNALQHRISWPHRESTPLCMLLILAACGLATLFVAATQLVVRIVRFLPSLPSRWAWLSIVPALIHPFLGSLACFLALCGAAAKASSKGHTVEAHRGGVIVALSALVLVATLVRGASVAGTGKAVLAEAGAGGMERAAAAWLVHVWGKGLDWSLSALFDHIVVITMPALCASVAVSAERIPEHSEEGAKGMGMQTAALHALAGITSIVAGQERVFILLWASSISALAVFWDQASISSRMTKKHSE
mmetsp:Transcript_54706/g.133769  ORF Transcript_54706/g.133769 Transcript_54706/m.133769 type:complete len:993 (+) Transcript_54706:85-3063(+)